MESRLPAHLEVSALVRAVGAAGGFATVIERGERDAGTLLVVCRAPGRAAAAYERMPQPDGTRRWTQVRHEDPDDSLAFWEYCGRRHEQDPDLWVVELDIADAERFIALPGTFD